MEPIAAFIKTTHKNLKIIPFKLKKIKINLNCGLWNPNKAHENNFLNIQIIECEGQKRGQYSKKQSYTYNR